MGTIMLIPSNIKWLMFRSQANIARTLIKTFSFHNTYNDGNIKDSILKFNFTKIQDSGQMDLCQKLENL